MHYNTIKTLLMNVTKKIKHVDKKSFSLFKYSTFNKTKKHIKVIHYLYVSFINIALASVC